MAPILTTGGGAYRGAVATATFDPSHTDSAMTLSSGNLVGTVGAGTFAFSTTLCTASTTSGLKYCEMTITEDSTYGGFIGLGLCRQSFTLTSSISTGGGANVHVGWGGDGNVVTQAAGGSPIATIQLFTEGDIIAMAARFDTSKIFFNRYRSGAWGNWNNNGSANPDTDTGGLSFASETGAALFPAVTLLVYTATTQIITANFGGSAYQGAPNVTTFGNWT